MMQKTLYENGKSVIIGISALFGVFILLLLISLLNNGGNLWHNLMPFYYAGFIIAGIYISGMAFSSFRSKEKTISYITLPASVLEKFISEWLLTTIGFAIGYTIIFYVFNFILMLFGSMLNIEVGIINVFDFDTVSLFPKYIIGQAMYLAGAATFKKAPFFKTLFSLFLFSMFLVVWLSVLAYFLKGTFESFSFGYNGTVNIGNNGSYEFENRWFLQGVKIFYYYLSAPAFWLYTYFKLKEKEA